MKPDRYYIVERVPPDMVIEDGDGSPVWYCHMKGFPRVPVFGSIGTKQKAAAVCRTRNPDGKVRYS